MYLLDQLFFYCTVTLLTAALLFAYSSQLPPSHPAAPPEHLKEPLAYMRKAQVSLSPLISVTPHLFLFYLLDTCLSWLPNPKTWAAFFLCVCVNQLAACHTVSEAKCVYVLLHRPAGRSVSSKA